MQFHLVNTQDTAFAFSFLLLGRLDPLLEFLEMMHAVIAHTDTSHFTSLDSLDQSLPSTQPVFLASIRCMEKIQVNIVKTGQTQGFIDDGFGSVVVYCLGWYL